MQHIQIEITTEEKRLLLEMIDNAEEVAIQGTDRADTRAFKGILRGRIDQLNSLREKLNRTKAAA